MSDTTKTDDTPREKPLQVPWTWGEYYAVRYLSARRGEKLNATGIAALQRGILELARESMADHIRRGEPVPQRLALLAHGEIFRPSTTSPTQRPPAKTQAGGPLDPDCGLRSYEIAERLERVIANLKAMPFDDVQPFWELSGKDNINGMKYSIRFEREEADNAGNSRP